MRTPKKKTFLNHVWQYFQSWSGSPASRCQTYQRIVLLGNDSIALCRSSCSVTFGNGNNTIWHDLNVFSRCICTQQDGQWPSLIRKSSHRVSTIELLSKCRPRLYAILLFLYKVYSQKFQVFHFLLSQSACSSEIVLI